MRAAIYARVSTERQERQQTIDSQLAALRAWASAQGHSLVEQHVFRDEGYSGSRLDRPGLDGLRDAVRDAAIDVVAVLSPDRLARKYAYQVLLLEEFRRAGCEVAFLHRPISDDPNDQLLLQIQGAIAEYERAVLAERFRRGKLQKARDGHIPSAKAPYGYRYEPRRDAVPARLVVDEAEADMVRQLHAWVMEEGLTVRQCVKRLNAGPWVTRSGRQQWAPSVVHHVLSDPVYTGTAYANRFEYVVPKKARCRSPRSGERTSRRPRPPEQWIAIPVPALIDQQAWDSVQDRLARNAATSFRHSKRHDYLLRCLLKCGTCGLGIHGCYFPGHQGRRGRRYYRCARHESLTSGRESKCPQARIEADVWNGWSGTTSWVCSAIPCSCGRSSNGSWPRARRRISARSSRASAAGAIGPPRPCRSPPPGGLPGRGDQPRGALPAASCPGRAAPHHRAAPRAASPVARATGPRRGGVGQPVRLLRPHPLPAGHGQHRRAAGDPAAGRRAHHRP